MKTLGIIVLAAAMFQEQQAPQTPPPEPAPAPAPAPTQAPPQQQNVPSPNDTSDAVRRQQEYDRQRQQQIEYDRQRQEQQRQRMLADMFGDRKPAPPPIVKPFIAPLMQHDPTFDVKSIPLSDWIQGPDIAQIPWNVDIKDAKLRMDQRVEVAFSARMTAKDVNKLGKVHDFYFISLVSDAQARFFAGPKVVHYSVKAGIPKDVELRFTDWAIAQPGDYSVHLVLYDRQLSKHSVVRRLVHVDPIENDPLPLAGKKLPPLEFSVLSDREGSSVLDFFEGLDLPVRNKTSLDLRLFSVLSPPDQWIGRKAVTKGHTQLTASAITALSQLHLNDGTISATGLDLNHGEIPFQQTSFQRLNWQGLAEAFVKMEKRTVSFDTLTSGGASVFFRKALSKELANTGTAKRVFLVISSAQIFVRGSDTQPIKVEGDCNCRVYHLRIKQNPSDLFDDIEKLLKPLQPKTFTLENPRDLRKAMAQIIQDLEEL